MPADTPKQTTESSSREEPGHDSEASLASSDSLTEIDEIVHDWSERHHEEAERNSKVADERKQFLQDFERLSVSVIQPTMQAAVDRLERDGGGGLVEEHQGVGGHGPRVTLWMALEGAISGDPREDRNPYLRLDADIPHRMVTVWEGDMWENKGGSGASTPWELGEVSAEGISKRVVGILKRAATHRRTLDPSEPASI